MSTIKSLIAAFDFNTLSFHKGKNQIFFNRNSKEFEAWTPDTSVEIAEQMNNVFWVGSLTKHAARQGRKPTPNYFRQDLIDGRW